MKPENVIKQVAKIENTLNRMENGMYVGVTIGAITDKIAWLWKFRLIDYETMTHLTAHARYVIGTYKPD